METRTVRDVITDLLPGNLSTNIKENITSIALKDIYNIVSTNEEFKKIQGADKCFQDILYAVSSRNEVEQKPTSVGIAIDSVLKKKLRTPEKKDFTMDV